MNQKLLIVRLEDMLLLDPISYYCLDLQAEASSMDWQHRALHQDLRAMYDILDWRSQAVPQSHLLIAVKSRLLGFHLLTSTHLARKCTKRFRQSKKQFRQQEAKPSNSVDLCYEERGQL